MLAFLFAGCGKDKSSGTDPGIDPDILEGTWRVTESNDSWVEKENGEVVHMYEDKTDYPYPAEIEELGLTVSYQPYIQMKNNIIKTFNRYIFTGEFPEEYKNFPKDVLLLMDQGSYTISGNKMIVTFFDEEEEEKSSEMTYDINGNTVTTTNDYNYEHTWEDTTYTEEGTVIDIFIKVPDSEVANPIDIEPNSELDEFLDEYLDELY